MLRSEPRAVEREERVFSSAILLRRNFNERFFELIGFFRLKIEPMTVNKQCELLMSTPPGPPSPKGSVSPNS